MIIVIIIMNMNYWDYFPQCFPVRYIIVSGVK